MIINQIVTLGCIAFLVSNFQSCTGSAYTNVKCSNDYDCFSVIKQFCKHDVCTPCIDCRKFNRNTGLKSKCLKDVHDCGSCSDGYMEVHNGHDSNCIRLQRKTASVKSASENKMMAHGEHHSSKTAPNLGTEIAVTMSVVLFLLAAVVGIMIGAYIYLHRRKIANAKDENGKSPRLVEMEPMMINSSHPQPETDNGQQDILPEKCLTDDSESPQSNPTLQSDATLIGNNSQPSEADSASPNNADTMQ